VVGPGFAQPNTGASITRENSGNGALLTRGSEQGERKNNAGQMTDAQQAGDSPRITVSACSVWLVTKPPPSQSLLIVGDHLRRRSVQFHLVVHFLNQ
jgi:hypothetical protein